MKKAGKAKKKEKDSRRGCKPGKVKYQKGEFAGNPGAAYCAARFGEFERDAVILLEHLLRLRKAGLPFMKDPSALRLGSLNLCLARVVEILFSVIASRNAKVLRDVADMIERHPDEPVRAAADPDALDVLDLAIEGDDEFANDWRFKKQSPKRLWRALHEKGFKATSGTVWNKCDTFGIPKNQIPGSF